jgi:archaemetzincin
MGSYVTVVHDLRHNFGIQHYPEKKCYIRDAEGRQSIDEEKEFCPDLKNRFHNKHWIL